MKNIYEFILASLFFGFLSFISCSHSPKKIPIWDSPVKPEVKHDNKDMLSSTDMVLIYGGGHHRNPYRWNKEILKDYVIYEDKSGKSHWLFDSFLLLEFMDPDINGGAGKTLITGYKYNGNYMPSANKQDWENLINYYFSDNSGAGAIDEAIEEVKKTLGEPKRARTIIVGIPEPITCLYSETKTGGSTYWGEIGGEQLDFSNTNDRIKACKWYIDKVIEKFKAMKYLNIRLAGFYWVAEQSSQTKDILYEISSYINNMKYTFSWIPYYRASGYTEWRTYGFNYAYLQPNYFFNESIPYSRLDNACAEAKAAGMDMELEFDDNALKNRGRDYKLRDYMKAFKENGIWKECRLAYYQGSWAVRSLKNSSEPEDNQLYYDLCEFIISRPLRTEH